MTTIKKLDEVLTEDQLANRYDLAVGTLRNWRRSGKGPKPTRLGDGPKARVVYKVTDVMAYEEQQKEPT